MRKLWQLYSTVNFFKEIKPFSDSVQQRVASPKIVYKRSLGEWEFLHLSSVVWTTRVSGVDYNTGKVLLNFPTLTGPNRDISTSPQIKLHVIFRHVFLPSPPTINVDMSAFWTHLLNIARAGEGRAEQCVLLAYGFVRRLLSRIVHVSFASSTDPLRMSEHKTQGREKGAGKKIFLCPDKRSIRCAFLLTKTGWNAKY